MAEPFPVKSKHGQACHAALYVELWPRSLPLGLNCPAFSPGILPPCLLQSDSLAYGRLRAHRWLPEPLWACQEMRSFTQLCARAMGQMLTLRVKGPLSLANWQLFS